MDRVVRLPRAPGEGEVVAAESLTTAVFLNAQYRPAPMPKHVQQVLQAVLQMRAEVQAAEN